MEQKKSKKISVKYSSKLATYRSNFFYDVVIFQFDKFFYNRNTSFRSSDMGTRLAIL